MDWGVYGEKLWGLLFPMDAACFACNKPAHVDERGLCQHCAQRIAAAAQIPPPEGVDGMYAGFLYVSELRGAIHRLKYSDGHYIARYLAAVMEIPDDWEPSAMVPVPLHPSRLKERGYNQSEYIAKALQKKYDIPIMPLWLARLRNTRSQTSFTREERRQNMKDAFEAAPQVKGKNIVLVDDIVTTGSTVTECACALRKQGAAHVYVACAAVTAR